MPSRRDIFVNRAYYHIFNKTIDKKNVFLNSLVSDRFIDLLSYYRSSKAILRYSMLQKVKPEIQKEIIYDTHEPNYHLVDIIAYCLMPNHFHLLVRQKTEKGIQTFLTKCINAITRYFNILSDRKGPIFLTQFKSRQALSREDLIHVSRYIHLNPYSSGIVQNMDDLISYKHSSLNTYLTSKEDELINHKELLLNNFIKKGKSYSKFIFDNADYQKSLEALKYIKKWN